MAIGIGKLMGFDFPENFMNPYISGSITEFWKRWHMTLGQWMRNYLYIPLGGNRLGAGRTYFNLWVVFLISGFWHGASWTFVIWGAYHGFFMVIERLFPENPQQRIMHYVRVPFTFIIVVFGWVLFRAATFSQAFSFIARMINIHSLNLSDTHDLRFKTTLLFAVVCSFAALIPSWETVQQKIYAVQNRMPVLFTFSVSLILFFLSLSQIAASRFNPFIYFRF
jgi:alginate O-acetyltransferase complex protein AlgI